MLEGAGGKIVQSRQGEIGYALSEGSEIEVLRTTKEKGKTAINLTATSSGRRLSANAAPCAAGGKAGADTLTGGRPEGRFRPSRPQSTLRARGTSTESPTMRPANVVDVTQILGVAAGTNVLAGGYVCL